MENTLHLKQYYLVIYCSLLWVARVSSLVLDRNYRNGEMTDYKIKRDQHMKTTDAHRREDIVNNQTYVLVQIPDDIKNTVTTPEWLTNWEEAEFMSAGGMYGKPHGWDIENVTVRAAYWLALMTSEYG